VILDGSKALRKGVRAISARRRSCSRARSTRYATTSSTRGIVTVCTPKRFCDALPRGPEAAQRLLLDVARLLENEYPSAPESVREGLEETLTVLTLNCRRDCPTLGHPTPESLVSRTRT
jgi:hypothetical protein